MRREGVRERGREKERERKKMGGGGAESNRPNLHN